MPTDLSANHWRLRSARYAVLTILCATFSVAVLFADQEIRVGDSTDQPSSYHETRGYDSKHTYTDPDLPEESHNPDAEERARLRVRWEKASMGFYDARELSRPWQDSDALDPGRRLAVRGKLLIVSKDGRLTRPIDWTQGVRIILARSPRTKPDWSKRHDTEDSAWTDTIVKQDGTFFATMHPDQISRPIGRTDTFQIGLSLGTKTGRSITWKNSVPVLSQSVGTIAITGPQPLPPTMQAINGAPSVREQRFNPTMLIRAVNHLHALGKDKAIAELREFLKIAHRLPNTERDPANIDTSDHQCVFLIVRLLFEPARPGEKLPSVNIGVDLSPPKQDEALWPLFPLVLQDDLPFILNEGVSIGGLAQVPSVHVDWAEKKGKLRARPLRPSDDPLGAVEKLAALPQTTRLTEDFAREQGVLRRQGWRIIEHLTQRPTDGRDFLPSSEYDANADWAEHKRIAAKLKIRWDQQRQRYVAQ